MGPVLFEVDVVCTLRVAETLLVWIAVVLGAVEMVESCDFCNVLTVVVGGSLVFDVFIRGVLLLQLFLQKWWVLYCRCCGLHSQSCQKTHTQEQRARLIFMTKYRQKTTSNIKKNTGNLIKILTLFSLMNDNKLTHAQPYT